MMKEARELQRQTEELNNKLIDKKNIGWQEKKQIQELLEKQKQLQQEVENIKQQNLQKDALEDQYSKPNDEVLQQQEQLEKLQQLVETLFLSNSPYNRFIK